MRGWGAVRRDWARYSAIGRGVARLAVRLEHLKVCIFDHFHAYNLALPMQLALIPGTS